MKTEAINEQLYSTTDLTTAVTLSLFFPLETIDKTNPRKATFVFKRNPQLDDKLKTYWRRELLIEPQAFSNQLKALKTRLYYE